MVHLSSRFHVKLQDDHSSVSEAELLTTETWGEGGGGKMGERRFPRPGGRGVGQERELWSEEEVPR